MSIPATREVFVARSSVPASDAGTEVAWTRTIAASKARDLGWEFDPTSVAIRSTDEGWRVSWLRDPQPVTPWAEHHRHAWANIEAAMAQREEHAVNEAAWHGAVRDVLERHFRTSPTGVPTTAPFTWTWSPATDEEPWDILDAAVVGTAWWLGAVAVVVAALAAVLVLLGIRKAAGR